MTANILGNEYEINVVRLEQPPIIDGDLGDEIWKSAVVVTGFGQVEPISGAAPSERTEMRVFSTSRALYLGVRCFDSDPGGILAKERRRDSPGRGDDRVRLVLDTFGRAKNGYYFGVAGGGGKADGVVRSGGRPDLTWDTIWACETSVDQEGWSAEFEIPFRSLAFDVNRTSWGFNVEREIRRRHEKLRWASPTRLRSMWSLQGLGKLTGLKDLDTGIGIDVRPTLLARYRSERGKGSDFGLEPSLDGFYRLTPSLTATWTWKTDFAETDVDDRQVNMTRFPLFFPEKRSFFLEDAKNFRFGGIHRSPLPFHSRTIGLASDGSRVPIQLGGKLTGKSGKWNLGFLGVKLDETEDLKGDEVYVGRVSYDVLEESSVGGIFTLGDPRSNSDAETYGLDFELKNSSLGELKEGIIRGWAMATEGEQDGYGWGLSAVYPNNPLYARASLQRVGENLDPAVGFIRRPGIYEFFGLISYELYPEGKILNEVDLELNTQVDMDMDRNALSEDIEFSTEFEFESGDRAEFALSRQRELFDKDFEIFDDIFVPAGNYNYWRGRAAMTTAPSRGWYVSAGTNLGGYPNGERFGLAGKLGWQPTPSFSAGFGAGVDWFDLEGGDFETLILNGSVRLAPTKKVFVSSRVQFDTVSGQLGLNSRLRWMVTPASDIYLVFNQGFRRFDDRFDRTSTEAVAKVGWTFRF
ncbi:MAG: carbohydrate binding family 9 domain-containing protein [Verrucomicrobiales bacterium]